MCKGLFSKPQIPNEQLEFALKDTPIDEKIFGMSVGESISFPISKKGSVTGRVSDLNRKFAGEKIWHTRTMRVDFTILVIRDR